jgi:hypothetical protein
MDCNPVFLTVVGVYAYSGVVSDVGGVQNGLLHRRSGLLPRDQGYDKS